MLRRLVLVVGVAVAVLACTEAQAGIVEGQPYVEIWTDRGTGSIYRMGEEVEIFMRAEQDCYVIVYEIDTDGYLQLVYPYDCYDDGYIRAGRIYRLGPRGYGRYYVTGPRGMEYIHVLASFSPFRQLYWHGCEGYEDYAYDVTWSGFSDYWGCALPPRVYGDPYMAMQSIDEFICYDAIEAGVVWADFTYFYVDERVRYPRYLCYDCHGFVPHMRPYTHICTGFSISFVDCDPFYRPWSWWWWCTPTRVYCGPRYVCYSRRPCTQYPSQYKWKSKCETSSYAGYDSRGREPVKVKSKSVRDVVRVKTRGESRDLDLYSRREPRGVTKQREPVTVKPEERSREGRVEVKQVPAKVEKVRSRSSKEAETRKPPTKTAPERTVVKKSSSRKSGEAPVVKSSRASASKTKRVAPKVRTTSKGRSPSTRRRVSR